MDRYLRSFFGLVLTLGGTWVVGQAADTVYPIRQWLFWQYAELWLWLLLFSAACTSFGQLLLVRVFDQDRLPALESAVLSMLIGTVSFVMGMYLAGAVGWFRPWFALALPFVMLVASVRCGVPLWHRLWNALGAVKFGPASTVAAIFGCCCLGITYLRILTPDALTCDATWFYVKIAQDYARWGHIAPFDGDYASELPHLASLLYTWGYLLPGLHRTLRWVFPLHMEMCLMLWTLAGIAAVVSRQVEGARPRSTWVIFFLFPGTFVFGLWGTGDHVTAFFAIGVALAVLRAVTSPTRATFALLAVPIAGGLLTKYQAIYLDFPALAAAIGAWAFALRRRHLASLSPSQRRDLWWAPVALGATCALLLAPHLGQNIIFHRNPVYPLMQRFFVHSVPTVPNGWLYFDYGVRPAQFVPAGSLVDKFEWALKVITTPSLQPRSLRTGACSPFVLLLPALIFLPWRAAHAWLALIGLGSLFIWAMVLFDLRHIETFAPVLVAVTAALVVRLWRLGFLARLGLVPLVLMQLAWGIDAAFWDTSRFAINSSLHVIQAGLEGKGLAALDGYFQDYVTLGQAVPPDAKLLLHASGTALGIDRDVFMDMPGFQGQIYYGAIHTPRELYDRFRELGVTHLVHMPSGNASPTKQEDILFYGLAAQYGVPVGAFGGLFLTAMPKGPPPVEAPYRVVCAGLSGLSDGLYPIEELRNLSSLPVAHQIVAKPEVLSSDDNRESLLQQADAVLCASKDCSFDARAARALGRRFELIGNHVNPWWLYEKRVKLSN